MDNLFLSILAIVLMLISNILLINNKITTALIFAAFTAIFVFIATIYSSTCVTFTAFASFTATVAALSFLTGSDKTYKVASTIFYILMIVHIVLLFV